MIYKDFQDIKLSGLGLGTMRLPILNNNAAEIDEDTTAKMFDYAIKHGINYFDTAWGYHNGNSEIVTGKCLARYPRESFYLATKFPGYDNSNFPKVKEIFEKQLEKLQVNYFDFYLFHNVYEGNIDDYLNPAYGVYDYLIEQKRNGRIKHLGFSCHGSLEVLERFLNAYGKDIEFCQLQLNYMDYHFQDGKRKIELLDKWNIPIWVMEPLRGGRLAKASPAMSEKMNTLRPEETIPGFAFRFLQSIPSVTMVLSGMSNPEQLEANITTWNTYEPLNEEEFKIIVEQQDEETKSAGIPCTACEYCTSHCPQGLPIPKIIALYNEHKITGGGFLAPMGLRSMSQDKRPANCIGCGACAAVCPQQISIPEIMSDFTKLVNM